MNAKLEGARQVVAVMDTAIVSGPGRQLAALGRALLQKNVRIHVILIQRIGAPAPPLGEVLDSYGVSWETIEERFRFDYRLVARFAEIIASAEPSVVQTHGYKASILGYFARKRFGIGWLAFYHGDTAEDFKVKLYHAIDKKLVRSANHLFVMSKRDAERLDPGGKRTTVLHNAILPEVIALESASEMLVDEDAKNRFDFGVIGRLSYEKGVDLFLMALARTCVKPDGSSARAIIVGDGPDRQKLEKLASQLNLTDRVQFTGPVHKIGAIYQCIDVLVIPSRSEGLPNVLLEALAADRFVVATDVGAVADVIGDSIVGHVVKANDTEALTSALDSAKERSTHPGIALARKAIFERFAVGARADTVAAAYEKISTATISNGRRRFSPDREQTVE